MTSREARRALGEMRAALDEAHVGEVEAKLAERERDEEGPPSAAGRTSGTP